MKLVKGEGMPINKEGEEHILDHLKTVSELPKGDLYVRFDIHFPSKMSNECKESIVNALRKDEEDNQ